METYSYGYTITIGEESIVTTLGECEKSELKRKTREIDHANRIEKRPSTIWWIKGNLNIGKVKRYETLLRATYELLKKCHESHYVLNVMEETVFYDGTDCDGACLMEDIKSALE